MKNVKALLIFLVIFLVLVGCNNQTEPSKNDTPPSTEQQVESSPGFFWKVENEGNTVYMLGSIHIGDESFYPLDEEIEQAFAESKYLGVEADMKNLNEQEVQSLLMQDGIYMDGTTIEDHIEPELFQELSTKLAEYQLEIEQMKMFKPWFLELFLHGMLSEKLLYDPELGIDMHFLNNVKVDQEIIELESVELQLNMFEEYPDVQAWALQNQLMVDSEQFVEDTEKLVEVWKSGDIEKMEDLVLSDDGSKEAKIYNELMLDKRNEGMTAKIDGFLTDSQKETYFVVLGTAHFIGKKGIVSLLEEKGYKVERYQ